MKKNAKGFTLIELLVVISVITLLSSVIAVSISGSRARAEDTAKKAELSSMRTALTSYKLDHDGKEPIPVKGGGGGGYGTTVTDTSGDFQATIQPLIDGHYLAKLPSQKGYFYFATTTDSGDDEAVIGATLIKELSSHEGSPGTCRPFLTGVPATSEPATCPLPGYYVASIIEGGGIVCYPDGTNGVGTTNTYTHTQCSDGIDNDGDSKIDASSDPGCVDRYDNGESPDPVQGSFAGTAYCSQNTANTDYCLCI